MYDRTGQVSSHARMTAVCRWVPFALVVWLGCCSVAAASGINPDGISGRLVICGGGAIPQAAREAFVDTVNAAKSPTGVVIIGTAASDPNAAIAESAAAWVEAGLSADQIQPAEVEPSELASQIDNAAAVWIAGGQQSRLADAFVGTPVESALQRLLERGGIIGGTSAGAAIMSRVMIAGGDTEPQIAAGLDLLPGAIIDQHFRQRNRQQRSQTAVDSHPERFGLGIDEATAVLVQGRNLVVVGEGSATVMLAESKYRGATEFPIEAGQVSDIVQLQRASRDRSAGIDPGIPQHGAPIVESGALVIVGGGAMPDDVVERFIELAGGSSARIVVLPTAVPRRQAFREGVPDFLANADVEDVRVLPHSRPDEIASEEFQTELKRATGIWFGGGRQWRFVDAYEGTNAIELFHDVLKRGGVVAGSSAGATIQGEYLVRGHPLGNTVMMAEGYERGFGFLPAVAIDQHFSQRGRRPDLLPVIVRQKQLLGIGIDEGTALVVQRDRAEVIGEASVFFLRHARLPTELPPAEEIDSVTACYVEVPTGESVNLHTLTAEDRATVSADESADQ